MIAGHVKCEMSEKQVRKLPKSRGEESSETGLAATALEGKLVKGE